VEQIKKAGDGSSIMERPRKPQDIQIYHALYSK